MSETANAPIMENEHVQQFLSIMKENGKDASAMLGLLGYVTAMESQLSKAVDELTAMRRELGSMREERDHPVRTALEKASKSLESTINETRERLNELKEKIVEGCKNAVAAFKEKGASVLNNIAQFFRLKPAFESLRNKLQSDIKHDQAIIAKIDAIGTKYHTAGMHLRNVGRVLRGKEALTAVKPNGKLAKLAAAPFRTEMKCLQNAAKEAGKAIEALDRLEKSVPQKAEADRGEGKPSVKETMKKYQKQIDADRTDAPVKVKTKRKEAEI